jgi:hypothetical protein
MLWGVHWGLSIIILNGGFKCFMLKQYLLNGFSESGKFKFQILAILLFG